MSVPLPGALLHEGLVLVATVGSPVFLVMLGVGLGMGILQAATQINDASVSFLPRAAAAAIAMWLFGGWIMERFSGFIARAIVAMAGR